MNILLINHYAGSPEMGMEFRPYYLAKEWVKAGHQVTIIGSSYSHLRTIQPVVKKDFTKENIDGIDYIWVKGNTYKTTLHRIMNIFSFVLKLYFHARKIAKNKKPDVVIASSTYPLDIYPSRRITHLTNAKLIYEIHDLWPLSPMEIGGYSKNHPFIKVMQKAEDYCYKHADKVISVLRNAEEHIKERHFTNVKFTYIPNGYCKNEWQDNLDELPDDYTKLFTKLKDNNKFVIGYSGGHTPSTALSTLLKAATILYKEEKFAFVLVGDGPTKNDLMKKSKQANLKNVYFLNSVKKANIPKLIAHFDVAYMGGVHSVLHKYGTSFNKMTDYMLAAKPVVFSADEPDSLIERIACGIRVEAENAQQVADAIIKLANKPKEELKEIGERGEKYASENLEYGKLAKKFIEEIENI